MLIVRVAHAILPRQWAGTKKKKTVGAILTVEIYISNKYKKIKLNVGDK